MPTNKLRGKAQGSSRPSASLEAAESEARALRDEVRRMRNRIESLRGALKTASGWIWDGAGTEIEANERADKCIEMAGDMEPPLMGSNEQAPLERRVGQQTGHK